MGPRRTLLVIACASRLAAWLVAALTLALVIPRRNPLLGAHGWASGDPFPALPLLAHVFAMGDRWDASWYSHVALDGYDGSLRRSAFFPLYPAILGLLRLVGLAPWVAGTLLSLAALAVTALLLRQIVLEFGGDERSSVWVVAMWVFFPAAVVLGAVYPESLLCALIAGAWLCALRGRRGWCGLLCGLAVLTKALGIGAFAFLLLQRCRGGTHPLRQPRTWLGLLVGATVAALWPVFLYARFGSPWRFLDAQQEWNRVTGSFNPVRGFREGALAAGEGVATMAQRSLDLSRDTIANLGDPLGLGMQDVIGFAAMSLLVVGGIYAWHRLGAAAGVAALLCALLPLASPSSDVPLLSASRFLLVSIPVFVAVGMRVAESRWRTWWLAASASSFGAVTAAWTAWQWVG